MSELVILGVDPGLSGAAVILVDGKVQAAARDFASLLHMSSAVVAMMLDFKPAFAAVELVGAFPGQGVASSFGFGRSTGVMLGTLHAAKVPVIEVAPAVWMGHVGVARDGLTSPTVATCRWPDKAELFKRKKDHATADAALLADYAHATLLRSGRLQTSRSKDFESSGTLHHLTLQGGQLIGSFTP